MNLIHQTKKLLPKQLTDFFRPPYHFTLAWLGSVAYRHPSKDLTVIAVTGTKGKSTVVELTASILEKAGYKTASLSTIQFRVGDKKVPNLYKMTTPGRFFVQSFLREAADAGCTHAVIELTSEGARQFRHRFIQLDGLIFTNLTPEHIESHGSFKNYKNAKLEIVKQLERSKKKPRFLVVNTDDEHGVDFLDFKVEEKIPYNLNSLKLHTLHKDGVSLVFENDGEEMTIRLPLVGLFNVYNAIAAIKMARALGVPLGKCAEALRDLEKVRGRVEHFHTPAGANKKVTAIVDYAHTPDSLEKLYLAFKDQSKICVLGNTGGGRDTWKRPEMAAIAEQHCRHVILTNEDPYDENPRKIVDEMAKGIENKDKLDIIMDRREAIRTALDRAYDGEYVLISGKGTDPYIMGPNGTKELWSDATVVTEELGKIT